MHILFISLIFLGAGIGAEVIGFGISAISMAFLPLLLPLPTAIPLVAIISVIATGIVAYRTKATGLKEILLPLFWGSVLGIPLGMYSLQILPERNLVVILAILLIFSSSYSLLGKEIKLKTNTLTGIIIGFVTGIFGASVNVNGPLVGMYLTINKNIDKEKNKDLITTYMFFTGLFVIVGHFLGGRIDREVGIYTVLAIPSLLIGLEIGKLIFDKVPTKTLKIIVYLFVLLAGIRLLFS